MLKTIIDEFHLKDIKNEVHPSVFYKHEDYDLFIFKTPILKEESIGFVSTSFIITQEDYYCFDKKNNNFIKLDNIKGFYKFLDKLIDTTMQIVMKYFQNIEDMEDEILNLSTKKDFNKRWFLYKNDITKIHRVLHKSIESLEDMIYSYKKEPDYLLRNFEDIHEHLNRAYRNCGLLLEKLDSIYNFNQTQTNEQMNRIVYILTLLSGIFLPLNLIVGFFGMNTTSLPFTIKEGGTYNVISMLIISGLLALFLTIAMKKR